MDDLSNEEWRRLEGRWKSDVDLKLDRLIQFARSYEDLLLLLTERERRRKARWDAIIEKSLSGLIWASVIFVGTAIVSYGKRVLGIEDGR